MYNNKAYDKLEGKDWYKDVFESELELEMLLLLLRYDLTSRSHSSTFAIISIRLSINTFKIDAPNTIQIFF